MYFDISKHIGILFLDVTSQVKAEAKAEEISVFQKSLIHQRSN